jgi:excisionase family DNA binding protein
MTAVNETTEIIDRPVLTVAEVASMFGVSRWLVQQAAHTGELPCIRLGRRILFPRVRIDALVRGDSPDDSHDDGASAVIPSTEVVASGFPQMPSGATRRRHAG